MVGSGLEQFFFQISWDMATIFRNTIKSQTDTWEIETFFSFCIEIDSTRNVFSVSSSFANHNQLKWDKLKVRQNISIL